MVDGIPRRGGILCDPQNMDRQREVLGSKALMIRRWTHFSRSGCFSIFMFVALCGLVPGKDLDESPVQLVG